jgi:hypothetical protein
MKKLILTFAMVLAVGIGSVSAQRSLLGKSDAEKAGDRDITTPKVVAQHNLGGNQDAPLGSGVAVLLGLGAAYMVAKKRKED